MQLQGRGRVDFLLPIEFSEISKKHWKYKFCRFISLLRPSFGVSFCALLSLMNLALNYQITRN